MQLSTRSGPRTSNQSRVPQLLRAKSTGVDVAEFVCDCDLAAAPPCAVVAGFELGPPVLFRVEVGETGGERFAAAAAEAWLAVLPRFVVVVAGDGEIFDSSIAAEAGAGAEAPEAPAGALL